VCEALVAAVGAVVDAVADVRRVDTLAARQTVERAVAGATRGAGHRLTAAYIVRTAASATTAAASGTHRAQRLDSLSPSVVRYRRSFSAAVSVDKCTHNTTEIASAIKNEHFYSPQVVAENKKEKNTNKQIKLLGTIIITIVVIIIVNNFFLNYNNVCSA